MLLCNHWGAASILQTSSSTASPDRQRAIKLYQEGNSIEARDLLLDILQTDKADYLAWYYLGFALIQLNKPKDASRAFESAIKIRPDFAVAHSGLGYSLLFRNKFSDAIRAAEAGLKLDPNLADANYVIGVAHLRRDNQDEALRYAEKALKINPQFARAYTLKSLALTSFVGDALLAEGDELPEVRRQRFANAADALQKYLELDPTSPQKASWTEQLENLRFHSQTREKLAAERNVFVTKDLTTRARVISKPEPQFTAAALDNRTRGTVVLRAVFSADATVKHILVVRALPDGLTEICIAAARRIKFIPATMNGRNVSTFIQLEYNFISY
jgi:tetratricopeptide (TPR) repeat protein